MDPILKKSIANSPTGIYVGEVLRDFQVEGATATVSVKTVDLAVNVAEVTIAGSSFEPPINFAPRIGRGTQWSVDGTEGIDVSDIIQKYVKNGEYYDVVITPLEDELLNTTIAIL